MSGYSISDYWTDLCCDTVLMITMNWIKNAFVRNFKYYC